MKKLIALFAALLGISVMAVGPKIPYLLTITPGVDVPECPATGFYFYWRTANGTYSDAQRWPIPTNGIVNFDLRVLGLPKGVYICMATATNAATGAESSPSPEGTWVYQNPNSPKSLVVQ